MGGETGAVQAGAQGAIQVGRLERIFIIDGKVATGQETADPLVFTATLTPSQRP